MSITYIFFYNACKAQGIDRNSFPYTGWFQPWSAYLSIGWLLAIVCCFGYTSFAPWATDGFFSNYTMLLIAPVTFTFWKLFKKTKFVKAHEADLVWERPIVDAYEESFLTPPLGFWTEMLQLVGIGRNKVDRRGSTSSY